MAYNPNDPRIVALSPTDRQAFDALIGITPEGPERDAAVEAFLNPTAGAAGGKAPLMVPWLSTEYERGADIKSRQQRTEQNKRDWERARALEIPDAAGANYQNPEAAPPSADPNLIGPPARAAAEDPTNPYYQNPEGAPPTDEVTTRDRDSLLREPWNWDPETYADITRQMGNVGLIDAENFKMVDVLAAWEKMVNLAAERHLERPDEMLTPMDMLDIGWGNGQGSEGSEVKRDPVTVVNKSVTISTNEQARGLLRSMLAEKLGRKPTVLEIDDFQAALNEAQKANPRSTSTTSSFNASGRETSQVSTVSGGMDEGEFAEDYTDFRDPDSEYGRYQAATTYYNALRAAIVGPGGA
jgi:uncharacterized protein YifE (UPF0438 family)